MMWETSIVMALHSEWVDLPRAQRVKGCALPSQLKNQPQQKLDRIANANAELGDRVLHLAAARTAKLALEMLKPEPAK